VLGDSFLLRDIAPPGLIVNMILKPHIYFSLIITASNNGGTVGILTGFKDFQILV
jgi:hypothetical protein